MRKVLLERITKLRKRAGLSARALSLKIGHQEDYIARVTAGRYFPDVDSLKNIAEACGSSWQELFYEDFEAYQIDKEILEKVKSINKSGMDALISLLAVLHHEKENNDSVIA